MIPKLSNWRDRYSRHRQKQESFICKLKSRQRSGLREKTKSNCRGKEKDYLTLDRINLGTASLSSSHAAR